jgi:hypothetical protein
MMIFIAGRSIEMAWIQPSMEVPAEGAAGRTQWGGMVPELRNPPRITLDNDPYYWVSYAREMADTGQLRIRHTNLDNVPFGREVHWNSGFMAWLVITGHVTSWFTGESLHDAIYTGSLYANPALFLIVLAVLGWCVMRQFGLAIAAGFVLLMPALPAIIWDFGYARADHHGMHNTAALGMLLFLVLGGMGWVRAGGLTDPERGSVRLWPDQRAVTGAFVLSGVFGAMGLWVGATQQIFLLTGAGLALLGTILTAGGSGAAGDAIRFNPSVIRMWGITGCVGSLALYLWEYFPGHLGMRLEVNHPIYAFAWLGAAEVLYQIARYRLSSKVPCGRQLLLLAVGFFFALLPAVVLVLGSSDWHAWRNEFMRRQHDFINEFEPFSHALRDKPLMVVFARFGLLPIILPAAIATIVLPMLPARLKALILPGVFASLITGAMMFYQVRWAGLVSVSLVVLAVGFAAAIWGWVCNRRLLVRWIAAGSLAALLVVPNLIGFAITTAENRAREQVANLDPYLAWLIASRDVAFNLKRIAAREPVRVMSGPGQTPALHFFGGIHGTGALYWENIDGVYDAAAFFSDPAQDRALEIVRKRGITHVVIEQSPSMAEQSCAIYYGEANPEQLEQSLAWRLASPLGDVPDWLEPVPYYGSPMAANFLMRIYKVRLPH